MLLKTYNTVLPWIKDYKFNYIWSPLNHVLMQARFVWCTRQCESPRSLKSRPRWFWHLTISLVKVPTLICTLMSQSSSFPYSRNGNLYFNCQNCPHIYNTSYISPRWDVRKQHWYQYPDPPWHSFKAGF